MLLASGANYGFRKTIPHMLGISVGFSVMVILVGVGILQLFDLWPVSYMILKYVSTLYLLYLAFKIATSTESTGANAKVQQPQTFLQASFFQWVNPKAWTMVLTALSLYTPDQQFVSILLVAIIFGVVMLPSISVWVVLGQSIQHLLSNQRRLRWFNISMAALLIASLIPSL